MATLSSIFQRVTGGAPRSSIADAESSILQKGGFGRFSMTGMVIKSSLKKAFARGDADNNGSIDVGEFTNGIKQAAIGKALPTWEQLVPTGATSLDQHALAELVKFVAEQRGGAFGGAVDADGLATLAIALIDDNGNGSVEKTEYEQLLHDIAT